LRLLAIDPASNKCGIALFEDGKLIRTETLISKEPTPIERRLDIARLVENTIKHYGPSVSVSEEPLILGRNNNNMQRLLGYLEMITRGTVHFIHPMTIKKHMGHGSKDKLEVALAAGEKLQTEFEKEILAQVIDREAWDESDAIAIGLTHMERVQ
jgi:Holliday junction resolvasome RuvABC endonuclease subunit